LGALDGGGTDGENPQVSRRPPPPELGALLEQALPGRRAVSAERIGVDRGVFSVITRVVLDAGGTPASVVVKAPVSGPNGEAAAAAGAYRREAFAYREVLPVTPVRRPGCWSIDDTDPDRPILVLDDVSALRSVDQLDGLTANDVAAVARALLDLHRHWLDRPRLATLPVRRAAPGTLDPAALERGPAELAARWSEVVDAGHRAVFDALLGRRAALVEAFAEARPLTLCHGDPRADNLVFDRDGPAVLFDWQQIAVQFPESDLAWLLATSTEPEVRRAVERGIVSEHAIALGLDPGEAWNRYRLGLVLPGLAVLLLAQRQLTGPRATRLAATSLRRIATAIADLEVTDAG
jgi:hypothetical protein